MSYKSLQYYSQLRDAASGIHHYGQAAIWGASTKAENSGDVKREHSPQHRPTPGQGQQLCWLLTGGAAQYEALGCHEVFHSLTAAQAAVTFSVSTSSPVRAASMKISWKRGQPFLFLRSLHSWGFGPCASVTRPHSGALVSLLLSKPEPSWALTVSCRQGDSWALLSGGEA